MNLIVISGRLTKDVELRQSGETAIARFSVAVDRMKEGADFFNCVAFNKAGETISKYMAKGSKIVIQGHVQTGNYEKDGHKVYTNDVIVDRFEFGSYKEKTEEAKADDGFINIPEGIDEDLPFN